MLDYRCRSSSAAKQQTGHEGHIVLMPSFFDKGEYSMKKAFAFTKARLIAFLCCSLLPALAMVLAVLILIWGVQFAFGLALTYFILPLIAIGFLGLCMFSRIQSVYKGFLSGVILACFVISFFFASWITRLEQVRHYEGTEVSQYYTAVSDENPQMPSLSKIGRPANIEYYNVFQTQYIFSWETDYLICHYTPEEYAVQKGTLDENYVFQTETITEYKSNCEPLVQMETYFFRMLSIEEYDLHYPKQVILIGYSDDTQEIVYASFYDFDIDYISSLQDFITDDCGWKHIR